MGQADLEINRKSRSVLVRHWIDLGHLSMRSINGRISVRGNLQRVFGHKVELTPTSVGNIFNELRRASGAKSVTAALENWTYNGGAWRKAGGKSNGENKKQSSDSASDEPQDTYVIDE